MPYSNVMLISKKEDIIDWCKNTIQTFYVQSQPDWSPEKDIHIYTNPIVALKDFEKNEEATFIIADRACCPVKDLLAIYFETCEFKGIPMIIFDTHKTHTELFDPEFLFRRAYYLEPFKGNPFIKITRRKAIPLRDPFAQKNPFKKETVNKENKTSVANFFHLINSASKNDVPCLLVGESGSGKTFYANFIHSKSSRKDKELVYHNISELTPSLAESQLFGTEANAYTGAHSQIGVLESANGTTLFLDEIGDLPLELQPKLLSVLERKKVRRLGSQKEHSFDARLIFATNHNLEEDVKQGKFRQDLYYRINILKIVVPPLRDHPGDIGTLAEEFAAQQGKSLSPEAIYKLERYGWPGNIRELQNVILRSCILTDSPILGSLDLRFE